MAEHPTSLDLRSLWLEDSRLRTIYGNKASTEPPGLGREETHTGLSPLSSTAWVGQEGSRVQHSLCVQPFICPTAERAIQGETIGEGDLALRAENESRSV